MSSGQSFVVLNKDHVYKSAIQPQHKIITLEKEKKEKNAP